VVPVHNELDNLKPLVAAIETALGSVSWELLLVDDGSTDGSDALIRELHAADPRIRGVFFGKNQGQTAAISAGIREATAPLTATMDADLQNDPSDLPAMLDALGDNDAVVGWRRKRQDNLVRRWSSRIANAIRNKLSRDSIRDTGCSLKVFRAEAIRRVPLFEGMHRFFPTLLRYHGYSVAEHPV
ncbi:MAG: glycosyltransferase family 2 protein, partial [Planctomycetes bacterium]|nr:glycosyltransferase family 2 protein [Planctomycetota bacterium]